MGAGVKTEEGVGREIVEEYEEGSIERLDNSRKTIATT